MADQRLTNFLVLFGTFFLGDVYIIDIIIYSKNGGPGHRHTTQDAAVLTWWKRQGVMMWCVAHQGMQHGGKGQGVRLEMSD